MKNAGPSRAAGAVLRAELPPGVVPVAWSGCENDPRGPEACLLGELAADEERPVVLTVEAAPELAGTAMTQTVDTFSSTLDPDPDDNAASATVRLGSPEVAELGLELAAPASVTAGGAFTLTARVTNRGAAPAADVVLTAALHAGLELLESRGCREDPGGLSRCTLGLLGVGALEEAHFDFAVDEGSSGPLRIEVRALSPSVSERPESSADVVAHEPDVLPLLGGRFAVRVDWHDSQGQSGSGRAVPFSDNTGFFWFFGPRNLELVATLLDGGAFNGHFWFFYAGLTSHGYDITVTDLVSGIERTYRHPAGELCGGGDTTAFPDADGSSRLAPASPLVATNKGGEEDDGCAPGPTRLCLTEDRFRVEVAWRVPATGEEGRGRAVPGTEDTGFFWFFNPRALDLAVKVLDGRAVNGRFWVFSGGLSHVEHEITVTDTLSRARCAASSIPRPSEIPRFRAKFSGVFGRFLRVSQWRRNDAPNGEGTTREAKTGARRTLIPTHDSSAAFGPIASVPPWRSRQGGFFFG